MGKLADLMLGDAAGRDFKFTYTNRSGKQIDLHVWIRPLTMLELDRARVNAEVYVASIDPEKRLSEEKRAESLFDAEQVETLAIALRDPDKPDEIWAGPAELRGRFSSAEFGPLLRAYHDMVDSIGATMSTLTAERYDALVEACAKDASDAPLLFCDSRMRKVFVASMAAELLTLRMAKSSPMSDLDVPEIASSKTSESESSQAEAPSLER